MSRRNTPAVLAWLLLAWIAPAAIAGMLGWRGIWGSSSALGDFLIPIPVAGGALHVPSFLLLAGLVWRTSAPNARPVRLAPIAFAGLALVLLVSQLDFERLNFWLFTDYAPSRSPLRLTGNPLGLFLTSDAVFATLWLLLRFGIPHTRAWWAVLAVPPVAVIAGIVAFATGDPVFKAGIAEHSAAPGNTERMVFTTASFDPALLQRWYADSGIEPPWLDLNAENAAIYFTSSRAALDRRAAPDPQLIIATMCLHERDQTQTLVAGKADCFAGYPSFRQRMSDPAIRSRTGLGDDVDRWLTSARLCRGVNLDIEPSYRIADAEFCRDLRRKYPQDLLGFKKRYGHHAQAVRLIERTARTLGFEAR